MRIRMIGACLIVSFLAVLLLSNTVSAADGPPGVGPIGVQNAEISPSVLYPGDEVTVTIEWWITHPDYLDYYGPFDIKIGLESDVLNEYDEEYWEDVVHVGEMGTQGPYIYRHTRSAPSAGLYTVEVQITAPGLSKDVGHGRYLLVASAEEPLNPIPEFSTIAIPVAAILGLFFFNHRKRRKK
ncbi:MAG: PEF-CTERM sorting domain-containing protein [Methanophagales archaeon]|nr:PEF-CTERM sorting domain-containing protein [Methanophagales archaeon]